MAAQQQTQSSRHRRRRFIGHHLVTYLEGAGVLGARRRPQASRVQPDSDADEFELLDLRRWDDCLQATRGIDEVYALAADMGGMGFISAAPRRDPAQQRADQHPHPRGGAPATACQRYLYTSSACVYPEYLQTDADVAPLREEDAYPAAAAGRLRLGEAHHRAPVPALPRGLRDRDAHRPLPQHLRPARHLGRRPREGAGGAVPQGRASPS